MANLPRHPVSERNQNLTDIVKDYFRKGYMYPEMLEFLKVHHKEKKTVYLLSNVALRKCIAFVDLCWEDELTLMRSKKLYKRSYMEVDLI